MRIAAQLAIRSKYPGDREESRVLAVSPGALDMKDFEALFRQLNVGTIQDDLGMIGGMLPWVTFGVYVDARSGAHYLAAIRREMTSERDGYGQGGPGSGRPIAAECCVCLPFSACAAGRATYTAIYAQMPHHRAFLEAPDSALWCTLPEAEESVQSAARDLEALEFSTIAATAALLLESPIALLQAGERSVEERLAYLEAVASLLPYGCRSDLSISSWAMSSASECTIRLNFSNGRRRDQERVPVGESRAAMLRNGSTAQRYYALLQELHGHYPLAEILSFLSTDTGALSFARPTEILSAAKQFDRPYLVWQQVVAGRAATDDVREVLVSAKLQELEEPNRLDVLRYLLGSDELQPGDALLLAPHWRPALLEGLCQAARRALQGGDGAAALQDELGDLAFQVGVADAFLALLLQHASQPPQRAPGSEALRPGVIEFVARCIDRLRVLPQARAARAALLADPQLVGALILHAPTARVQGWIEWLARGDATNRMLRVYACAAGLRKERVSAGMLNDIERVNPLYVLPVFSIAAQVGGAERVIDDGLPWLMEHLGVLETPRVADWEPVVACFAQQASLPFRQQVRADLLALVVRSGYRPDVLRYLLSSAANEKELKVYMDEVAALLGASRLAPHVAARLVTACISLETPSREAVTRKHALLMALSPFYGGTVFAEALLREIERLRESSPELLASAGKQSAVASLPRPPAWVADNVLEWLRTQLRRPGTVLDKAHTVAAFLQSDGRGRERDTGKLLSEERILGDARAVERFVDQFVMDLAPLSVGVAAHMYLQLMLGLEEGPSRQAVIAYRQNLPTQLDAALKYAAVRLPLAQGQTPEETLVTWQILLRALQDNLSARGGGQRGAAPRRLT